jgi:hypothetical protein
MRMFQYIILFGASVLICPMCFSETTADTSNLVINSTPVNDSNQYKLIVFDPEFDVYLANQPSVQFYSENYYKTWNIRYISEWNYRYISQANTNIYESSINYEPYIDYGLEVEYRLYYFFRFFEHKNHIVLVQRGK